MYGNGRDLINSLARPGPTRICALSSAPQALPSLDQQESCKLDQMFKGSKHICLTANPDQGTKWAQTTPNHKTVNILGFRQ